MRPIQFAICAISVLLAAPVAGQLVADRAKVANAYTPYAFLICEWTSSPGGTGTAR